MQEIKKELFDLIYQASLENEMVYYKDLKNIISSGLRLDDFIKKMTLSSSKYPDNPISKYSQLNKKITLYEGKIFSSFQKYYYKADSLDRFSRCLYSNIHITKIALHEAFHASHLKILKQVREEQKDNLNLEELIISIYYKIFGILFDQNANMKLEKLLFSNDYMDLAIQLDKNRCIDPMEIMATINANRINYDILNMDEKLSDIRRYYEYDSLSDIINLYQMSPYPTLDFFKNMKREELLEISPFYDANRDKMLLNIFSDYDLATRITYGLTVAPSELKQLIKVRDSYKLK